MPKRDCRWVIERLIDAGRSVAPVAGSNEPRTTVTSESALERVLCRPRLETAGRRLRWLVTGIGFWTAIVLPFIYVPFLLTGLENLTEMKAFGVLVLLNVGAVVLGQWHR